MTETVLWELVASSNCNINGGFSFDTEKLFIHIIKSYGLEDKAKNSEVDIGRTIDGAKLDSKVAHVSFGFKLTDKDSVCPIAEKNIFLNYRISRVTNGGTPLRPFSKRKIKKHMKNTLAMSFLLSDMFGL
jgi:hypothetical protein